MTTNSFNADIYPLKLEALIKEKVWGGRKLERVVSKQLPPTVNVGETWEAYDACRISNGKYAGQTLGALIGAHASDVLGAAWATSAQLPLLFKFLDAKENLSVQVHPDDEAAQRLNGEPSGKTEAWYVLHAEPGAKLQHGFKSDVTRAQWDEAIRLGQWDELLAWTPARVGDVFFVQPGLIHALGAGVVVAEIQQNSDLTYRVYDWGRTDRELHIEQATAATKLRALQQHTIAPLAIARETLIQHILMACRYFVFERLEVQQSCGDLTTNGKFQIVSCIGGVGELKYGPRTRRTVPIKTGETLLLPAQLGAYMLAPIMGEFQLLRSYVPDLRADVIAPLRAAGYADAQIAQLGGEWDEANDVKKLL